MFVSESLRKIKISYTLEFQLSQLDNAWFGRQFITPLCCARETMCATLIKERNVLKVKYRPMLFPRYNLVIFYD